MIGFGDQKVSSAAIKEAVEKIFTPEFRNRLDAIIPFNSLDEKTIRYITKNEIKKLNERLFEKNVEIRLSDDCIHYLAKEGYSAEFGARNISRTIDEKISEPLVEEVLFGKLEKGGIAHCSIKDGKIEIEYEAKAKKRK
jgi:ATP-dependent Clp protease ATP-binding subunit ClpA